LPTYGQLLYLLPTYGQQQYFRTLTMHIIEFDLTGAAFSLYYPREQINLTPAFVWYNFVKNI
jgi:hypothetical protein